MVPLITQFNFLFMTNMAFTPVSATENSRSFKSALLVIGEFAPVLPTSEVLRQLDVIIINNGSLIIHPVAATECR